MKFLHRTKEENWKKIQEECILFGCPDIWNEEKGWHKNPERRYTYLSPFDWGDSYGDVLLEVEYTPSGKDAWKDEKRDNYIFDTDCPEGETCDQFMVFIPISLKDVKRIDSNKYDDYGTYKIDKKGE